MTKLWKKLNKRNHKKEYGDLELSRVYFANKKMEIKSNIGINCKFLYMKNIGIKKFH